MVQEKSQSYSVTFNPWAVKLGLRSTQSRVRIVIAHSFCIYFVTCCRSTIIYL